MNPLRKFESWRDRAEAHGVREPNAMVLATADSKGRPSARVVLYKGIREGGIRFFTNYDSRKARELAKNPYASLVFFWPEEGRSVRFTGRVHQTDAAESDEYWATRPRESQIGAHASRQSRPLLSWTDFVKRVAEYRAKFRGGPVPRPPHWGGFHLVPSTVEFWTGRTGRLHQRVLYTASRSGKWSEGKLYP